MNLNFEGFTFPELYENLAELGLNVEIPTSGGGGLDRIGDDLFRFMMPDGRYVYFDSQGEILKVE